MSTIYTDGTLKPEKLICRQIGSGPQVSFESMVANADASVLVQVGDIKALISREEIAAAAALWPSKRGKL